MDYAEQRRQRGNARYKVGEIGAAEKYYTQAHVRLDYQFNMSEEEKVQANKAKVPILLNMAAIYLKKKPKEDEMELLNFEKVVSACDQALLYDATQVKGYMRRAQALWELGNYERCQADCEMVLKSDPGNSYAKRYLALAKKRLAKYAAKEKKRFGGLFK